MTAVIEARQLGKRYLSRWALADCTLSVPTGSIAGLVGPNGAGSLDPLARRDFLQDLLDGTAEHQMSVVLSSHLVADLERVCDYLIVLAAGRVQAAGTVTELTAGAQTGLEDLVLHESGRSATAA